MKLRLFTILPIALVVFASCGKEMADETEDKVPAKEYVSFHSGETKTAVDASGNLSWEAGDEITITYEGASYKYIADNSGSSTSFSPKTEADRIPAAPDHTYTLVASYGDSLPLTQTIASDGSNGSKLPLEASVTDLHADNDEINLHFSSKASLLRLSFAQEALQLKNITLSGLSPDGELIVDFPDGLDLSKGSATAEVIVGAINSSAEDGVLMNAICADGSRIARVIWAGVSKRLAVGTLVDQPLSTWKTQPAGISTGKELKEFAILVNKGCPVTRFTADGTPGGKVELLADVDISNFVPWAPIGSNGDTDPDERLFREKILCNEFDGQGHNVIGLTLEQAHDSWCNYGLFGVADAEIHDLTVGGSISIGNGSDPKLNLCVGGVVSTLLPGHTIERCTSGVNINVSYYGTEPLNGSDVLKASSATVHKWQRAGGIAGRCSGNIRNCENTGVIKFTNGASAPATVVNCHYGGIAGQVCGYGSSDVLISDCTNSGTIASQGKIGGYSDKPNSSADISKVFEVFQGMSLGGIVGTFGHMVTADMTAQAGTATMDGCINKGDIGDNFGGAGGNFGGIAGRTGCDAAISITNCTNTKSVFGSKSTGETQQTSENDFFLTMGGVVGSCHARGGKFSKLTNEGNVYINNANVAAIVGGVIGMISAFSSGASYSGLSNSGGVYTSKKDADVYNNIGGVIGRIWTLAGSSTVTLDSPVNTGYIRNETGGKRARVGGLIGYTNGHTTINDGVNKGNVTAWTSNGSSNYCYVGGLIGEVGANYPVQLNRCKEYGNVSYNNSDSYHGLIVGSQYINKITATACHAAGTFGLAGGTVYTIASAEDFASMVGAPSTDRSITEGQINIVCLYDNTCGVGSPWQWSWHEVE